MSRPVLFVLAGVNGAGKSSIGGFLLERAGLAWFNPDTFARELVAQGGWDQVAANSAAWSEGVRRLEQAMAGRASYAFETTLGGETITTRLIEAAASTHDVAVWFCGLDSPERHLARVRARVAAGGHDIPEATIRERFDRSREHLVRLMPHLALLQVHDNTAEAGPDGTIPDPVLLLEMKDGRVTSRTATNLRALAAVPPWARPLLEAAIRLSGQTP
jgi:predicted ABC-type ATPase